MNVNHNYSVGTPGVMTAGAVPLLGAPNDYGSADMHDPSRPGSKATAHNSVGNYSYSYGGFHPLKEGQHSMPSASSTSRRIPGSDVLNLPHAPQVGGASSSSEDPLEQEKQNPEGRLLLSSKDSAYVDGAEKGALQEHASLSLDKMSTTDSSHNNSSGVNDKSTGSKDSLQKTSGSSKEPQSLASDEEDMLLMQQQGGGLQHLKRYSVGAGVVERAGSPASTDGWVDGWSDVDSLYGDAVSMQVYTEEERFRLK